mgnify:CR=1 FL=1
MNELESKFIDEGWMKANITITPKKIQEQFIITDEGIKASRKILQEPYYYDFFLEQIKKSDLPQEEIERRLKIIFEDEI